MNKHRDVLERLSDRQIGRLIGKGCWGSVFETDSRSLVVKITKDWEEVRAAKIVDDLRSSGILLPGLVDICVAHKLDGIDDDGEDVYVIVRERVNMLPPFDERQKLPLEERLVYEDLDEDLYVLDERQAYCGDDALNAMASLYSRAPHLAATILELESRGHRLADMDISNVGIASNSRFGAPEGSFVMFDMSFSSG